TAVLAGGSPRVIGATGADGAGAQGGGPPAGRGRMSSPGETHDCDTCTAATLMNAVRTASGRATRRFPVMSWRDTHSLTVRQAERTARSGRGGSRATMMAALYPPRHRL